jgi:uncharacterized caspase-like protein
MKKRSWIIAVFIFCVSFAVPLYAELRLVEKTANRYALLVANSDYQNISKLSNPANDARDIAAALTKLGYQVDIKLNLTEKQFGGALDNYLATLTADKDSEGFFWYAGHGVHIRGQNYLLPVDIKADSPRDIRNGAHSLADLLIDFEEAHNKFNTVILDAYFGNSFPSSVRDAVSGNADVFQDVPDNLFVMLSAAPGEPVQDGVAGKRNSPFTEAFLKHIGSGVSIPSLAMEITIDTALLTNGSQRPVFNRIR